MTKAEEKRIMRAAIDTYGAQAQTLMMFEEMAELQKALCKHPRAKNSMELASCEIDILDEIAEVGIMLEQIKMIYGFGDEIVQTTREHKLIRLRDRLGLPEKEET